ncbi:UNVERIFIED_CONTAM: Septin-9 [Gekko kuhli]
MTDTPRDAALKQAAPTRTEKPIADFGYVGIDAILEQMRRKAMKQGFEFNIMVVGFQRSRTCTFNRKLLQLE